MLNPEASLTHQLNTSTTKQAHAFPKQERFAVGNRILTEAIYALPDTRSRRSCSFGYGNKIDLAQKQCSPPPGTYNSKGSFDKQPPSSTVSFGHGREQVKFGSLMTLVRAKKNLPSPDRYNCSAAFSRRGIFIGVRLPTEIDLVKNKKTPGPGTYTLDVTNMKNAGKYVLSGFKNHSMPSYTNSENRRRSTIDASLRVKTQNDSGVKHPTSGKKGLSASGNLDSSSFCKSPISKFKNSACPVFPRAQRPGPDDPSKKGLPFLKYHRFSEFGSFI